MTYNSSAPSFIRGYTPYLQPTSSLGTAGRVTGAIAVASGPKIGGISRIYDFYKNRGQGQLFINQLVFDVYGVRVKY